MFNRFNFSLKSVYFPNFTYAETEACDLSSGEMYKIGHYGLELTTAYNAVSLT